MRMLEVNSGYLGTVVMVPWNDAVIVSAGDEVIFRDETGAEEYGVVVKVKSEELKVKSLKEKSGLGILRKATANDIQKVDSLIKAAVDGLKVCNELAEEAKVEMNFFRAGYSFDGLRAHFMFTAEDRVDFRELLRLMARALKKQINLKQIGPRDKAKLIGGFGKCGRPLCCNTWLDAMDSINMEMVRVQALESKGSSKLSGACGKLLCCLKYEVEAYKDLRRGLPRIGEQVELNTGASGRVIAVDILNQKVKVALGTGESVVIQVKELKVKS